MSLCCVSPRALRQLSATSAFYDFALAELVSKSYKAENAEKSRRVRREVAVIARLHSCLGRLLTELPRHTRYPEMAL